MSQDDIDRPAGDPPAITVEQYRQLRRRLGEVDDRAASLQVIALQAAAIVTTAVLLLGLLLPFLVPRSGEERSLTLMQAVGIGENGPGSSLEVIEDMGGGPTWLVPILATLLVVGVTLSLISGAGRGFALGIRRFLTGAYLVGCLLGFATLANGDDTAGAPPGLVMLTLGAVLAVGVSSAAPHLVQRRS